MNTWHKATDRRCYNGANCSDLQRECDSIAALEERASKAGGRCTYFHGEGWSVWVDLVQSTSMQAEKGDALVEFLNEGRQA